MAKPTTPSRPSLAGRAGIVGLAILATLLTAVAATAAAPGPSGARAAVFPPWWTPAQTLSAAAAAGDVTGVGAVPFILILRGDAPHLDGEGLDVRLRRAGALLLLNPGAAGPCAPPPLETRP